MQRFTYTAITTSGETIEGEMEGVNREQIVENLQNSGYLPIEIGSDADNLKSSQKNISLSPSLRKSANKKDVLLFTQKLATMLKAGVPLDSAMSMIIRTTSKIPAKSMFLRIQDALNGGKDLSEALSNESRLFNKFYISTIRAGESAGALDVVMERLKEHLDRTKALKSSITSALIYPLILVVVAAISLTVMMLFVVPQFATLFEDMDAALPWITQVVLASAEFFQAYWWLMLLIMMSVIWISAIQLRNPNNKNIMDRFLLKIPLVNELISKLETARFTRTLGTLVSNGVTLISGIQDVKEVVSNNVIRASLDEIEDALSQGKGLSLPMKEANTFPELAVQLISVGEESGHLEEMLLKVADIYDDEVKTTINRMIVLIEPILILLLGLVVAVIIIAILLATLSLNNFAPYD